MGREPAHDVVRLGDQAARPARDAVRGARNTDQRRLDAGELQRLSPPENGGSNGGREAKALSIVLEMLFHLPFVIR